MNARNKKVSASQQRNPSIELPPRQCTAQPAETFLPTLQLELPSNNSQSSNHEIVTGMICPDSSFVLKSLHISKFLFRFYALCLQLSVAYFSEAQKNIVISDALAAQADKLNVKMGTQRMGKIWKFRVGDYAVVSSKMGWTVTSTKGNLLNTKTESTTTTKFSFVLAGKSSDSAHVNAVENIRVDALQEIELLPHFSWGEDELIRKSNNFSAFINIDNDTSDVWALFLNVTMGRDKPGTYEGFLTNGERKILLVPASSNKKGEESRSLPALGYEFVENDQALSALQYYGGGMMGLNKNIVWIDRNLDIKMKLLLAAAMTAVLQVKITAPGG